MKFQEPCNAPPFGFVRSPAFPTDLHIISFHLGVWDPGRAHNVGRLVIRIEREAQHFQRPRLVMLSLDVLQEVQVLERVLPIHRGVFAPEEPVFVSLSYSWPNGDVHLAVQEVVKVEMLLNVVVSLNVRVCLVGDFQVGDQTRVAVVVLFPCGVFATSDGNGASLAIVGHGHTRPGACGEGIET